MPGMTDGSALPQLTFGRALTEWVFHPWITVVLVVLLVGYLAGVRRAAHNGESVSALSVVSWLAGLAVIVIATQGSPAFYGDALFWLHMVAHLLLIMVAPTLLVAGRPLDLLLAATPAARRDRVRARLEGRVVSGLTHPSVGLVVYAAAIVGTHLTGFMNSMMLHPSLHGIEALLYVTAGFWFFLPLIGDPPLRLKLAAPLRMAIYAVAMPIDTFTGVILGQTQHYPWPLMAAMHPDWASSPITDLHYGGAVMWIGGDAIMLALIVAAGFRWARLAAAGDGSELGGWLESARLSYQQELTGAVGESTSPGQVDSDEALAAYNSYLQRINARK